MIFLKVPYAEKDEAKALGARWNAARKLWYVPDGQVTTPFERWITDQSALPAAPVRSDASAGKRVEGARFIALDHDCNPFETCDQCRPQLEQSGWFLTKPL